MDWKYGCVLEHALRDPLVCRLRHDMRNKETAFRLSTQVLKRIESPEKRAILNERILSQLDEFGAAFDTYLEALYRALREYEAEEHGVQATADPPTPKQAMGSDVVVVGG